MKVSASILTDKTNEVELVRKLDNTNIDYFHIDLIDGTFSKGKSRTVSELKKILDNTSKKLDVHIISKNPKKYLESFALLNTEYFTFQYEAVKNTIDLINEIKNYGLKAGISINPETNIDNIFPYLNNLDMVLIMSVIPGESGQTFMGSVLYKIGVLKKEIEEKGYNTIISIDGGINKETGYLAYESGVDMLVSASFLHNDISNVTILKNIEESL